ncbi:hypothetical protein CAL12_26000 [Bordetella genomosp. 8]|uniref:Uncharacterized protein n=1 Tax=Bordetella genomosp. 8 TaxID=1416806 RepID=A0A1W6YS53_9BORD|nr:hypothetical protein CAL12_26000 [Bordetella genomosp. 8]
MGSHSFEPGAFGETGRASHKHMYGERPVPAVRTLRLVAGVGLAKTELPRAMTRDSTGSADALSLASAHTPDSGVPRTLSNGIGSADSLFSGLDALDTFDEGFPLAQEPPIPHVAPVARPRSNVKAPGDTRGTAHATSDVSTQTSAVSGLSLASTLTANARHHPDVDLVIAKLRQALTPVPSTDDAHGTPAARTKFKPAGASILRRIARAERQMPDALHYRALDFYKSLIALTETDGDAKAVRRVALMVAALAQRGHAEGYDAVDRQFVKRILDPLMHSLPLETLSSLARLNDRTDDMGDNILREAGKLLAVRPPSDRKAATPKARQAAREHNAASLLLGTVAELAREHIRAASWDRPGAAILEAAANGQAQQIDAGIREMVYGDLLSGEIDLPRVERLMDSMRRLSSTQQYAMATMLGETPERNAATRTFGKFMTEELADFERDVAIRDQMTRFVDDLRTACRGILAGAAREPGFRMRGANIRAIPDAALPPNAAEGSAPTTEPPTGQPEYPPVVTPYTTLRMSFRNARHSIAAKLRWTPTPQDAAKALIKGAVNALIAGDRLTHRQLQALQDLTQRRDGKGRATAASMPLNALVRERIAKLDPARLARLQDSLAAARHELQSAAAPDAGLAELYRALHLRLEKEAGIRKGAVALAGVIATLPRKKQAEALLAALDKLSDAQCQSLKHQSEMDFHEEALNRLGAPARKALHKLLSGRDDVRRYMERLHGQISYMPKVWQQYRQSQLEILSRLAPGRA